MLTSNFWHINQFIDFTLWPPHSRLSKLGYCNVWQQLSVAWSWEESPLLEFYCVYSGNTFDIVNQTMACTVCIILFMIRLTAMRVIVSNGRSHSLVYTLTPSSPVPKDCLYVMESDPSYKILIQAKHKDLMAYQQNFLKKLLNILHPS